MGGGALEAREAVKCQMSVSIELCIIFSPIPTHGLTPLTRSPEGARRQEATTHAHHSEHDSGLWALLFRLLSPRLTNQSHHIPLR